MENIWKNLAVVVWYFQSKRINMSPTLQSRLFFQNKFVLMEISVNFRSLPVIMASVVSCFYPQNKEIRKQIDVGCENTPLLSEICGKVMWSLNYFSFFVCGQDFC